MIIPPMALPQVNTVGWSICGHLSCLVLQWNHDLGWSCWIWLIETQVIDAIIKHKFCLMICIVWIRSSSARQFLRLLKKANFTRAGSSTSTLCRTIWTTLCLKWLDFIPWVTLKTNCWCLCLVDIQHLLSLLWSLSTIARIVLYANAAVLQHQWPVLLSWWQESYMCDC